MGASDDFDNENNAPVPPHERNWRHPAEVNNALRQEHALEATPPPIGRRAAALVAFVSVVASATLMLVTVQKGVSEPVAEQVDSTTTLPTKNSLPGGDIKAVHVFSNYFVLPSTDVPGQTAFVSVGDLGPIRVEVVTRISEMGLVVVTGNAPDLDTALIKFDPPPPGAAAEWKVVDRANQTLPVHMGIASGFGRLQQLGKGDWFALDVDGVIDGVGSLLADGQFCAIAVRHEHKHFGIALSDLKTLVSAATGAGNG